MELHEIIRTWAALVISFGSLGWMVYWSLTVQKRSAAKTEQDALFGRIEKVESALADDAKLDGSNFTSLSTRLQRVEDELTHMPSKEQIHGLQLSLSEMKADFRELAANMKPLAASVERIDNFLMDRPNRS